MKNKILLVDDEKDIVDLMEEVLQKEGFHAIRKAYTGKEAVQICQDFQPDVIVLDVMLPDMDGFEVCKAIREFSFCSILFLSSKNDDIDKILGLSCGGDDYITKPFSVLELISRVRAILRRCSVDDRQDVIKLGQIVFDDSKHIVTSCGEECNLTFKEYELLKYLLKNKGMALTRENIILNVWGYDFEGESRTVDMHITTLRQKLGSCGNLIKTVRNVGYKAGE